MKKFFGSEEKSFIGSATGNNLPCFCQQFHLFENIVHNHFHS